MRRSPEQIATLALILCTLMACVFVPRTDELVDTTRAAAQPVSQVVGEVTGKVTLASAIAVHKGTEAVELAASSWTSRAVPAGKHLWEEWGMDIIRNTIAGLLTTGLLWGGGRSIARLICAARMSSATN